MLNQIFHFIIVVCCSVVVTCSIAVSAEKNSSMHLHELTISYDFIYSQYIENISDDSVHSSFSLFYLDDSYEKYRTKETVEVEELAILGNADDGGVLELNDLIEIAFAKNRLLEVVKQQQAQSRGQLTQARSSYLPQLSVEGRYSYIEREESAGAGNDTSESELSPSLEQTEKDDVVHGAVNFSQLIYDFGKTTGAIEAGKTNLLASNAKLHRQIQDTIYQVKTAYYNILEKRRLIDVAQESVKSFQEHLDRAELYLRAGVRTKIDVINAEVELSNAKMLLVGAEYSLKTAKVALEQILGVQPHGGKYALYQDEISLDNILESMPHVSEKLERLIDDAMLSRPDIIQLTLLTASAEGNLRASKGDFWPSVAAQANYNNYDTELSLYKDSWEVGMVASWDLFSGLQTKGAAEEAQGRLLENRALLQD